MHNPNASALLDEAKRLVCSERSEHHGDTHQSMWTIAQFWQLYLRSTNGNDAINVTAEDVAQMLSLLKKVRRIFGDKANTENFVDDLGYTSIAGMFAEVPVPYHAQPSGIEQLEKEFRNDVVR